MSLYFYKKKNIYSFNETVSKDDPYKVNLTMKSDKILKCLITKKKNRLVLIDSYPILAKSFSVLANDFNVQTAKSKFPYGFSLKDNLFYIGPTPWISYYNSITKKQYEELFMLIWDFKEQSLFYLNDDLLCLYQVMTKVNKKVFMDYDTDLKHSLTVSY